MCAYCLDSGLVDIPTAMELVAQGVVIGQQPISVGDREHYTCTCAAGQQQRESIRLTEALRRERWSSGRR